MQRVPGFVVSLALCAAANLAAQTIGIPIDPTINVASANTVVDPVNPVAGEVSEVVMSIAHGDIRIVNLSTRAQVSPGNSLITGFAISGTAPRAVLIRAVGPGLAEFGVSETLATPRLELRATDGTVIAENNGWSSELTETFAAAGAFPLAPGSADSAVVAVLTPGTYTMQVLDRPDGAGGVALAEIYDLGDTTTDSRLVNVSSLTTVSSGTISGFILAGNGVKNFLVRGVGPGLGKFGVDGFMADPQLKLFDVTGQSVGSNNDWSSGGVATARIPPGQVTPTPPPGQVTQQTTTPVTPIDPSITAPPATVIGGTSWEENAARVDFASAASGAFPLERWSGDAAFVISLTPGVYTVEVSGQPTLMGVSVPTAISSGSASGVAQGAATAISQQVQAAAQAATIGNAIVAVAPRPGVALLEIYELPQ